MATKSKTTKKTVTRNDNSFIQRHYPSAEQKKAQAREWKQRMMHPDWRRAYFASLEGTAGAFADMKAADAAFSVVIQAQQIADQSFELLMGTPWPSAPRSKG